MYDRGAPHWRRKGAGYDGDMGLLASYGASGEELYQPYARKRARQEAAAATGFAVTPRRRQGRPTPAYSKRQ